MKKHKNLYTLEDKYIGHLIRYEGREFKILTYKQEKEVVTLITDDQKWIHTNVFDLGLKMDNFEIIMSQGLENINKKMSAAPVFFSVKNEAIEKTQDVLLNLLEDISNDKIKLDKVNAAVDVAEVIIKTEKIKIDMVSSMNKLTGKIL